MCKQGSTTQIESTLTHGSKSNDQTTDYPGQLKQQHKKAGKKPTLSLPTQIAILQNIIIDKFCCINIFSVFCFFYVDLSITFRRTSRANNWKYDILPFSFIKNSILFGHISFCSNLLYQSAGDEIEWLAGYRVVRQGW